MAKIIAFFLAVLKFDFSFWLHDGQINTLLSVTTQPAIGFWQVGHLILKSVLPIIGISGIMFIIWLFLITGLEYLLSIAIPDTVTVTYWTKDVKFNIFE